MTISKPFFVRPLDLGTITASPTPSAGHPAQHLNRLEQMGLTWKSAGTTDVVSGDFGSAQEVDFLAVISANAQSGTIYELTLSNNADLSSPVYTSGGRTFIDPAITRSDGLYHSHFELPATYTARYWRVAVASHTGDFEASGIVLGKKITPSHYYDLDFEYGVEDTGSLEIGRNGVWDEVPGRILRTHAFRLGWQSRTEFETSFRPMMEELGPRGIVYFCQRPDATTDRQANTYLGHLKKPGFARGTRKAETLAQEFEIRSII